MGSVAILDFQRLLQAIPGDCPSGIDLRTQDPQSHDSLYWKLRRARQESGEIERKHYSDPANPENDLSRCRYAEIITLSTEVLAQHSKDLEIVAWLCDSLMRQHGFAGLRDGLRLAREMAEAYWDTLYPALDATGEGLRARVSQFGGLFQARRHPAFRVALTEGEKLSELDFEQAQAIDKIIDPKEKAARLAKGEVTMQKFTDAVRETSTPFLKTLAEDIEESLAEGDKFVAALKPKCGQNELGEDVAPSAREFSEVLKKVLSVVRLVAGDRIVVKAAPAESVKAESNGSAAAEAKPAEQTRESAIVQLRELADFFRRIEPHSPIAHHLEEAIRWGQMSLPDLLTELVPDENARKSLFTRIGIVPAAAVKK